MDIGSEYLWAVDVEGNGSQPPEIVELAMVKIANFKVTDTRRHWLLRPEQPISPIVTRIHGITDADVKRAPSIGDIADDFLTWMDNSPIVGHNVSGDFKIISRSIDDWNPAAAIDTIRLTKLTNPELSSYSLANIGEHFDLSQEAAKLSHRGPHSALYDAILTALIFSKIVISLSDKERFEVLRASNILDQRQGSML